MSADQKLLLINFPLLTLHMLQLKPNSSVLLPLNLQVFPPSAYFY